MFQNNNFISLHDLSPTALFLWSSPSILSCLGWKPEEVIGVSPFMWVHPDDIPGSRVALKETVMNEIAGTQLFVRIKRKDGTYLQFIVMGIICYHFLFACFTIINEEDDSIQNLNARFIVHSAAMTTLMGSEKEELERISRNHKNMSSTWNAASLDMDLRACLFLNRFTRNLCVMYAAPACELILNIDPNDLLGKPLLLFIRADDLASLVEQADLAKSTATIRHLRFWFQSPNCRQEIPLEAMFLGTADALVIIFRKCLPFRRKQFITNYSSEEYFAGRQRRSNNRSRSYSNVSNRSYNSRIHSNSFGKVEPYSPYGRVHNSIRESPVSHPDSLSPPSESSPSTSVSPPPSLSPSSLSSLLSSSSSTSSSSSSSRNQGTVSYQAPLRNIPMGSINSIRNLDGEQTRLRPLASLHDAEPDVTKSKAKHLLREFRTQDSEVETCLVKEFEKIKLVRDRMKALETDEMEEDEKGDVVFDKDWERPTVREEVEEIQMPTSMRRQWKEE
ncbi:hypothetical protein BGX20_010940 [Mortierella sp. AD010]|nr:hypothetical protein BGX20_010940 [Mortierella sp. AD010]